MKVNVTKYLNVRVGKPSVNAPCYQYLAPGSELEVDGKLYNGDIYDGIDIWLKDEAGNYYWSGGVEEINEDIETELALDSEIVLFNSTAILPPNLICWNDRVINIPSTLVSNRGKGIRIAILDTGIEKQHLDLTKSIVESKDFTNSAVGGLDVQGHGTEMASLIAGNPFFETKGIKGVAPSAKIYSAKVMYDENDPQDFMSVDRALDYAFNNNVDIINLSIGRSSSVQKIADSISSAKNTVFFAATKECQDNLKPQDLLKLFPANCPGVIPVCALSRKYIDTHWNDLPSPLIIVPLFDAWCCSIKYRHYYFQDSGSSIATALVSGITALILSNNSSIKRKKQVILNELEKYSSTIVDSYSNPGNEVHIILKK